MLEIHKMTIDELGRWGVHDENRLHWNGEPVVTERRLSLDWWVNASIVAGGLSTAVLAVLVLLRFLGLGAG